MKIRLSAIAAACAALLLCACHAATDTEATPLASGIAVTGAWARATPPASMSSAAYFTLSNHGTKPDVLLSVSSPLAARAELHQSLTADGVARMRPAGPIELAAGQSLSAGPGGLHVMLLELAKPLREGEELPLTLHWRDAGEITVQLQVHAANPLAPLAHAGY